MKPTAKEKHVREISSKETTILILIGGVMIGAFILMGVILFLIT